MLQLWNPRPAFSVSLGCEVAASGITEAKSQTSVKNNGASCNVDRGPLQRDHALASVMNLDRSVWSVTTGPKPAWTPDLEINDQNHYTCQCQRDFK